MENKELEEKIAGIDLNSIFNTSPKALKELTNDYNESLVRLLMIKAKTIGDQKNLLKYIKKAYGIWQKRTNFLWSEHSALGGYPEYFDTMEANIESDRYITTSGSVPVGSIEYYQFLSQQNGGKFPETYSKNMVDAAIAAVKAQIPRFEYDQQNEGLSIVYGEDKGKINLDEVIEKKAKDVVNQQLEEMAATDADIDEIFADVYGQDLVDQVNKEMAEEEEQKNEDEDTEVLEDDENYEEDDVQDEWDDTYDNVFKPEINPQKVFEKLEFLDDPRVTEDYPRFFVFFKVLLYIGWIENQKTKFLKWANCHWQRGWENDFNFKFSTYVNKKIRDAHISKWGIDDSLPVVSEAYRTLAIEVLSKFTEKVNGGKIIDIADFYNDGVSKRINDGRKLDYPF